MPRHLRVVVARAAVSVALLARVFAADAAGVTAAAGPSADIQFNLCEKPARVQRALALNSRGKEGEVWLFDDAAMSLFSKGLRVRLRTVKEGWELTLKLAEQDCATLLSGPMPAGEGKCEYDLHGSKLAGALSLTHVVHGSLARDLIEGRRPVAQALSAAQTSLLRDTPGVWPLPDDLRALGPTKVSSYRANTKPYDVDVSVLPRGETFVEISRKVPLAEATQRRDEMAADLKRSAVTACADQSAQAVNKLKALLRRP